MNYYTNKIKLACLASLFAAGIANAADPQCNGFEIKIKNNLPDNLLIKKIIISGAEVQPNGLGQIDKQSQQTFTVYNSNPDTLMNGEFIFNTISLPTKEIALHFELQNKNLHCSHSDLTGNESGGYPIDTSRGVGKVTYSIG